MIYLSEHARPGWPFVDSALGESYEASPMFNCLPGTMLDKRHTHEWKQGRNCGRALWNDNADLAESHRLFNPANRRRRWIVTERRFCAA